MSNAFSGLQPAPQPSQGWVNTEKQSRIYWEEAERKAIADKAADLRLDPANIQQGLLALVNRAVVEVLPENRRRDIGTLSSIPEIVKQIEAKYLDLVTTPIKEVIVEKPMPLKPEKTVKEFSSAELRMELFRREEVVNITMMQVFSKLLGDSTPELDERVRTVQRIAEGEVNKHRIKRIGLIQFAKGQVEALQRLTPNHEGDFTFMESTSEQRGRMFPEEPDIMIVFTPRVSKLFEAQLLRSTDIQSKLCWVESIEKAKMCVLDFYVGKSLAEYHRNQT